MEEKLVTLAEHSYERALLLQTRLRDEGIDAVLSNVNLVQPDASAGVKVKVSEKDLEKAMRVYTDFVEDVGETAEEPRPEAERTQSVKKFLVPVDFSDYSRHAAMFAVSYASRIGAEILLLHAYYAPDTLTVPYDDETFGFQGTLTEYLTELRETARKQTLAFLKELRKEAGEQAGKVKMDYFIVKGSLDDAVFYAEESYHPDLIVLGARGKDKRRDDPIGSMTARILEKASVPVLVIPEDAEVEEFFDLKEVIYATRFDEADFQAVKKLMSFIQPFGMKILCVHFVKDQEDPEEQVKREGFLKYFRDVYPDIEMECRTVRGSDMVQGLNDLIMEHPVSAVALTTHRRNLIEKLFYPSVARKMFFHTKVPLLVFHS